MCACWCVWFQKEDYAGGKAPKGSIDLLQIPPGLESAAFLSGARMTEIHLLIPAQDAADAARDSERDSHRDSERDSEWRKKDKAKGKGKGKDRVFVLQAPDEVTAAAWLGAVQAWVLFLHC